MIQILKEEVEKLKIVKALRFKELIEIKNKHNNINNLNATLQNERELMFIELNNLNNKIMNLKKSNNLKEEAFNMNEEIIKGLLREIDALTSIYNNDTALNKILMAQEAEIDRIRKEIDTLEHRPIAHHIKVQKNLLTEEVARCRKRLNECEAQVKPQKRGFLSLFT